VRGGVTAAEKGGGAIDIAKGAAWGAADQVTLGMATWAYNKGVEILHDKGPGGQMPPTDQMGNPTGQQPEYDAMGNFTGNAPAAPAAAASKTVNPGPKWSPGQMTSENRNTSAELNTNLPALDVARGGIHPAAQKFYGKGDEAMFHSAKARGLDKVPWPAQGGGAGKQSDAGQPANGRLSTDQQRQYAQANAHYEQSHMAASSEPQPQSDQPGKRKGWSNAARIAAAQARGAQLPYNGDPTQGPDQGQPKANA
jgi:hypothetical protein